MADSCGTVRPLELVDTDDLVEEIARRFSCSVFLLERSAHGEKCATDTFLRCMGPRSQAVGLLHIYLAQITRDTLDGIDG